MSDVKRAMIAAVLLAFVAGVGAGAWVSDLRAASEPAEQPVDRRVQQWKEKYDLTPSQERRLRDVFLRYDAGRKKILTELDTVRWQKTVRLREEALKDVAVILGKDQPAGPDGGG